MKVRVRVLSSAPSSFSQLRRKPMARPRRPRRRLCCVRANRVLKSSLVASCLRRHVPARRCHRGWDLVASFAESLSRQRECCFLVVAAMLRHGRRGDGPIQDQRRIAPARERLQQEQLLAVKPDARPPVGGPVDPHKCPEHVGSRLARRSPSSSFAQTAKHIHQNVRVIQALWTTIQFELRCSRFTGRATKIRSRRFVKASLGTGEPVLTLTAGHVIIRVVGGGRLNRGPSYADLSPSGGSSPSSKLERWCLMEG